MCKQNVEVSEKTTQKVLDPGSSPTTSNGGPEPEDNNVAPIDRGWAWVIMFGCMVESYIVVGMTNAFGIFFIEFLDKYGRSTTMTSLISGVTYAGFSISSFLTLSIGLNFFSARFAVVLGTLVMCAGLLLTSIATNVETVILTYGLLFGVGNGLCYGPALFMVGKYFDKRRGLANGIAMSGGSLGALSLPLLSRYLVDEYDLNGAFMYLAGLVLQILIVGALFRPLEFYTKQRRHSLKTVATETLTVVKYHADAKDIEFVTTNEDQFSTSANKNNNTTHISANTPYNKETMSSSALLLGKSEEMVWSTLASIRLEEKSPELHNIASGCCISRVCCSLAKKQKAIKIFDCSILKNTMFHLYLAVICTACLACSIPSILIAGIARDIGVDQQKISYLISAIGISDFAGRVTLGFLVDHPSIRKNYLVAVNFMIIGITYQIQPIFNSYWSIMLLAVIYGLHGTASFSLLPVLLVDFCGLKHLSNGIGIMLLVLGVSVAAVLPALGAVRDVTGTYVPVFHALGVLALLGAGMLMFEPIARRKHNRNELRQSKQETEEINYEGESFVDRPDR